MIGCIAATGLSPSFWAGADVANEVDGIRTRNHRIDSPSHIPEDKAVAPDGAQEGASAPLSSEIDDQLAAVHAAWPSLPDHIKAAILALVSTAKEAAR